MRVKTKLILTPREQRLVQQSLQALPPKNVFHHRFWGKNIRFGYYGDPHMGEKHFHEDLWRAMIKVFQREGIKHVYGVGDNVEGMSGRPGQIYDLAKIGASAQMDYAEEMFNLGKDLRFHIIDGN
jgi:DNA polymerase II small subunit/DNA polymerase delta subunit B